MKLRKTSRSSLTTHSTSSLLTDIARTPTSPYPATSSTADISEANNARPQIPHHSNTYPPPAPTSTAEGGVSIKRASTSRYPPSSFLPLQGWSFGRMKSIKGKEKAVEKEITSSEFGTMRRDAEKRDGWYSRFGNTIAEVGNLHLDLNAQAPLSTHLALHGPTYQASVSEPGLHLPYSHSTVPYDTTSSELTTLHHHEGRREQPSGPDTHHQLYSSLSVIDSMPGSTSSLHPWLPRPLSIVSETSYISGDSAAPLMGLGVHTNTISSTTSIASTSRKLVKRRPTSTVYEGIEMLQSGTSRPKTHSRSHSDSSRPGSFYSGPDFTSTPPQIFTVLVEPPSLTASYTHVLPDDAYTGSQHSSSLNRNSSSSTYASTASPATEESDLLATPNDAFMHGRKDGYREDVWTGCESTETLGDAKVYAESDNEYEVTIPPVIDRPPHSSFASDVSLEQCDRPSSPTTSHTHSSLTNTPTVSSGSTARARHVLRLAISASDLHNNNDNTEYTQSPDSISADMLTYDSRRSVTFDSIETDSEVRTVTARHKSRSSRPPLVRLRTSSLGRRHSRMRSNSTGGISTNTNSVYSVGEVVHAEGAVLTPARMIRFGDLAVAGTTRIPGERGRGQEEEEIVFQVKAIEVEVEAITAQDTVAAFIGSSEAVRRAFQLDEQGGQSTSGRINRLSPRARRISHTSRPAPIAPHVSQSSTAPPFGIPIPKSLPSSPKPVRPGLQPRQSSISRLWRKMSTHGGKKRDSGSGNGESSGEYGDSTPSTEGSGSEIPLLPTTRRSAGKNVVDPDIPLVYPVKSPSPVEDLYRASVKTGNKLSKGKQPIRAMTSTEGIRRRIKAYEIFGYTDGEAMSPETSWEQINIPSRESSLQLGIPSRTSSLTRVPVPAAHISDLPLPVTGPTLDDAEGYLYAISGSIRRRRITIGPQVDIEASLTFTSDTSRIFPTDTDDSPGTPTIEQRRKYRQTLVEIKDDRVFQQVLEDLARLETARWAGVAGSISTPIMPMMLRTPSGDLLEKRARQESIKAWFVTRELVQGERRYGRLLARGVSTVQAVVESRKLEIPPVPASLLATSNPLLGRSDRASIRARRGKSGLASSQRTDFLDGQISPTPLSPTPMSPLTLSLPPTPPTPTSPLDLLLERLPRLLALSLTLSSNFEHDPSPQGCAQAFWAMEGELINEIGQWAGEVGNLVAMGMGGILDGRSREASGSKSVESTPGHSRRGSRELSGTGAGIGSIEEEVDDRLGFADIIIGPIQRASRYKLLFKELINKLPPDSATREDVEQALAAAERLAAECDSRQGLDLKAFRRTSGAAEGKAAREGRKSRRRPRSTGPQVGGWNWFSE